MSKTTGTVGAVSDYNDKDYYNIALGDPEDGNWFIGNDSTDLEKGQKVEIEFKNDNQIEEINILEEDNEDGQSRTERDAGSGSGDSDSGKTSSQNPQMSERDANKLAIASVMNAMEDTDIDYKENTEEWFDVVDEKSQALQNIMKDRRRENL